MITQHYRIKLKKEDEAEGVYPAQFVFQDDTDDIIRGFISEVKDGYAYFILFEPTDLEFKRAEQLSESLEQADIIKALSKAINLNPDMGPEWLASFLFKEEMENGNVPN